MRLRTNSHNFMGTAVFQTSFSISFRWNLRQAPTVVPTQPSGDDMYSKISAPDGDRHLPFSNLYRSSIEVEIEVSRHQILTLWRTPDPDAETDLTSKVIDPPKAVVKRKMTDADIQAILVWIDVDYYNECKGKSSGDTTHKAVCAAFSDILIKREDFRQTIWRYRGPQWRTRGRPTVAI